jgi:hypothetical protein
MYGTSALVMDPQKQRMGAKVDCQMEISPEKLEVEVF